MKEFLSQFLGHKYTVDDTLYSYYVFKKEGNWFIGIDNPYDFKAESPIAAITETSTGLFVKYYGTYCFTSAVKPERKNYCGWYVEINVPKKRFNKDGFIDILKSVSSKDLWGHYFPDTNFVKEGK